MQQAPGRDPRRLYRLSRSLADGHARPRIANGRPDRYPRAVGSNVSQQAWFQQALKTASGDEYSVADIAANEVLGQKLVATYATAVRKGGETNGAVIGVLGIFFDW